MDDDSHGQGQAKWFLWKEGVKPSVIHRQMSAVCGETAPAGSTVFANGYAAKETAQVAVDEWYCKTAKEWFLRKLLEAPKEMASIYDLEGKNVELAVVQCST
jgi:hypothetical protein